MSQGICFPEPGVFREKSCSVCGSVMGVCRNVLGPTSFAEAMAGTGRRHDRFECPHRTESWHTQAAALEAEARRQPSGILSRLLSSEAADVIRTLRPSQPM